MLRDYQVKISEEGLATLKKYGIVYLCMQVRTGKTLTALNIANQYGAKRVLFVTKKKAIASIQSDFEKLHPSFDLFVINYESVHTVNEDFDLIILDESHCLGQYPKPAEKVKQLKMLCLGKPIIYLSGSPTPESYSQIFHQLYVSSFSPFNDHKNFYAWVNAGYVKVHQRRYAHGLVNDYSNASKEMIDAATKRLFISYTQEEAGFTQMVQEKVLQVRMKDSTYKVATKLKADRVYVSNVSEKEVIADTEVKLMQKLHQIYSGTVITEDGDAMCFDMSKAEFIRDHFAGRKIAIFYKFRAELEMIRWAFKAQITESPEEFNLRDDLTFASQIQSGREGINLSTADALVMYNIDFSHVSYIQARARMQTKDRQKACELYWIFSEGGIEEKIYSKVIAKKDYQLSHFRKDYELPQQKKVA